MDLERWIRVAWLRLRSIVRRDRIETELDDEIRDHLNRRDVVHRGSADPRDRRPPRARRDARLRMVVAEAVLMVGVGIAIGVPLAVSLSYLVAARLFGVSASDPLTLAAASALMLAVGVAAGAVPAFRAARVQPVIALRCE